MSKIAAICVTVTEFERGWGQKTFSTSYFKTLEMADEYRKRINSDNTEQKTPDWYIAAGEPTPVLVDEDFVHGMTETCYITRFSDDDVVINNQTDKELEEDAAYALLAAIELNAKLIMAGADDEYEVDGNQLEIMVDDNWFTVTVTINKNV